MKRFEAKITGKGVYAISLVEKPANEFDLVKMKKHEPIKVYLSEEKRIITGVVLMPNQLIYRNNNGNEYEFYLSAETIEELSANYLLEYFQSLTLQHSENLEVTDTQIVESWLVADKANDKIKHLGFEVENGTWCMSLKMNKEELWDDVKTGKINGISIEALLEMELDESETQLSKILELLKS